MHPRFVEHVSALDLLVDRLLASPACLIRTLPREMPSAGIYLFSDDIEDLYVGRTNRLRTRLCTHCRESSGHNQATFAFLLARKETGRAKASYRPNGSRAELLKDPAFAAAFREAKARIRAMQVRFIEEKEPVRQALLEIYAAMRLATPFNDFDNH